MKHKLISIMLIWALILQLPCFAFFNKSKTPVIDVKEKIAYVNMCWWDKFDDPILKNYIIRAVEYNHDLKKASWQVEEYRQFVKYSFGQELPHFSVTPANLALKLPPFIGDDVQRDFFVLPFLASYEADFLLKNRDKTKSAKKTYEASKFDEQTIYISIASMVATTYLNIIKYDKLIETQCKIVANQKDIFTRQEKKYKRGVIDAMDYNDALKNYKNAKNTLEDLIKYRGDALNELAVLIGDSAENSHCLQRTDFDEFDYKTNSITSICSDTIFSRPDVLSAEAKLEKAKIDVRVARKEFFPSFNVIGIYAFNTSAGNFFSWKSTLAYLFTGAAQDIFKGGMKVANLKIQKSRYEQLFEQYHQVSMTALKEVNDSLLYIKQDTRIDQNNIIRLNKQKDNYKRQLHQYNQGVIACSDLLSANELLLNYEKEKIDSKANRIKDYFTLYKAVGGKI